MRIRYISDIHLEFIKPDRINNYLKNFKPLFLPYNEVLVLAGDIGNPFQEHYHTFMQHISTNFKKTFYIAGNHEYYGKRSMKETTEYLTDYFKKYNNITFLNNTYEDYEGYRFIGTTMWSHISNPEYEINDVYSIPGMNYKLYNSLNSESIDFLTRTLAISSTNNIIITHHQPSKLLVDNKYKGPKMSPYNQWFYCDMDNFIIENKNKIKCWIYGHTHTPLNSFIDTVPTFCNPVGYPGENANVDYNKNIILDE